MPAAKKTAAKKTSAKKPGLYANIQAKRKRIAAGSGEHMKKAGDSGAPTASDLKDSRKTAKKTTAKKAASKKTSANKSAAKKTTAKKATAKKAPSKKTAAAEKSDS